LGGVGFRVTSGLLVAFAAGDAALVAGAAVLGATLADGAADRSSPREATVSLRISATVVGVRGPAGASSAPATRAPVVVAIARAAAEAATIWYGRSVARRRSWRCRVCFTRSSTVHRESGTPGSTGIRAGVSARAEARG
jgi:hypothetical protein